MAHHRAPQGLQNHTFHTFDTFDTFNTFDTFDTLGGPANLTFFVDFWPLQVVAAQCPLGPVLGGLGWSWAVLGGLGAILGASWAVLEPLGTI